MGNFAQLSLPLTDSATLTIQRVNSSTVETITVRESRSNLGRPGRKLIYNPSCLTGLALAPLLFNGRTRPLSSRITVLQSLVPTGPTLILYP